MYSSARTKKVATYGRRVQRFIPVTEEKAFSRASPARRPAEVTTNDSDEDADIYNYSFNPLPKPTNDRTTSKGTSEKQMKLPLGSKAKENPPSARRPLAVCLTNIPGSPAMVARRTTKPHASMGKGKPSAYRLQPTSPVVDVDIIVLDDKGRRLSQERRVTKMNIQVNKIGSDSAPKTRKTPGRAAKRAAVKQVVARTLSIESEIDDDSEDDEYVPIARTTKNRTTRRTSKMPTKPTRKHIVQDDEAGLMNDDLCVTKKPQVSKRAKRLIVASDSESSFDANPSIRSKKSSPAQLSKKAPGAHRPSRNRTLKGKSSALQDPILIDLSPSIKHHTTNEPVRRSLLSSSPRLANHSGVNNPQGLPDMMDLKSVSLNCSKVPESHQPFQFTPTLPTRSKSYFFHQRRLSPMQCKMQEDNELDVSLSMSIDPELELALKVAELEIGDSSPTNILAELSPQHDQPTRPNKQSTSSTSSGRKKTSNYLRPILAECGQIMPFDFAAFIETFPLDSTPGFSDPCGLEDISTGTTSQFQKVGEASYSEVFGVGNVVLKVIPLTNEDAESTPDSDPNAPPTSDVKDVLREILVTRTMGEICKGFIKLLKAHVVQGVYPSQLLALWDVYNDVKGSESARPDSFDDSQAYAVIVLPNGGPDLETFSFSSIGTGPGVTWRQACSIFWQVTKALARAEDLVHFEHRDLHCGQILIRRVNSQTRFRIPGGMSSPPMDDPCHGVEATIIDLGLSRVGQGGVDTYWTPFTDDIFEGEGDYQYDIYRMMRKYNKEDWESFRPLTNVMWLHYLAEKLLSIKRLKPPTLVIVPSGRSRRAVPSSPSKLALIEADKKAYDCLIDMEKVLGSAIEPIARSVGVKSRRRTKSTKQTNPESLEMATEIGSATDVFRLGKERCWVL